MARFETKRFPNRALRSKALRAKEPNDKEVERGLDDEFPRIVRESWRRDATLVFLDEAGCMRTPTVRRTLAPRGQMPVVPALQRHDRLRAIRCVTRGVQAEQPERYFELLPEGRKVPAEDSGAFLDERRRELPGPRTVLWDRHTIHSRSRLVQDGLARQEGVVWADLPGYAPAVNPDEMV